MKKIDIIKNGYVITSKVFNIFSLVLNVAIINITNKLIHPIKNIVFDFI